MITMELLGKIRRMHARDKMSERAIAKRAGLSRNTVHKWLEIPEEVQAPRYVRAEKFGKLTALAEELEQALLLQPRVGNRLIDNPGSGHLPVAVAACCRRPKTEPLIEVVPIQN